MNDDQAFKRFADRVRRELVPMIDSCGVVVSICPAGDVDVKFAIELGVSIMLDKPIVACVRPGTKVPAKLVRVADEIIEVDWDDMAAARASIEAAIARLEKKQGG